MYIGDIYLPILSNIDKKSVSKITKEIAGINAKEPRTVSIRRNLQPITLEGYLYNDGEKDDAQYAEDVEALQYRSAGYCYTKYADLDGFIEIENAEAPQTSEELGVRNYSVEGKYLPASKYERIVEVETEMRENEFNIEFPPHVALPIGATNVRVKTSQDSVKLTAPAFMAGDIPIYRPFPAFYPDDVTHSTGDTPKYDTTAYKMSYNLLDAKDEYISYTFVSGVDVPLGSYRVVLRMKEDTTIASDARIVVLSGDNVVVDSLHTLVGDGVWNIVKSASFNITQRGITYTIMVSKAEADVANLAVNYGFLLPEKRARVAFDVAAEYDVGECKVFDTITTDSEESTWIQVFNPEHDFAGDIVVQNSMFRWVIKQTAWKNATKVYNISGSAPIEIGKLYNKAFGDDSVAIKFKEIKPNYLKFTFELDTGNATSESTNAKEIDTVEITPFNVVIDKDVIGAYKDHYTFESTPIEMIEYENGVIAGINSNSVYGLIKSVNVTSSYEGDIIETTGSESSDSYVVPFVIPCEITSYLYKQAADLVISKDNGDIERKFWKDDFSVDSSKNYLQSDGSSPTIDTANHKMVRTTREVEYTGYRVRDGDTIIIEFPGVGATGNPSNVTLGFFEEDDTAICGIYVGNSPTNTNGRAQGAITIDRRAEYWGYPITAGAGAPTSTLQRIEFTISTVQTTTTIVRSSGVTSSRNLSAAEMAYIPSIIGKRVKLSIHNVYNDGTTDPIDILGWKVIPSESYADDFTTDTTERYQPVLGTVAYDGANKRMNVTTATGANGKASGRLKSYKFREGAQQFDVTLPVGEDGDFICLVTHSANGLMTDGIGVGLQSDGAGNWNLATLSGTTVTEGADSGLVDGNTARIEIEKDITGAYWYYIYDAAGPKPTTATGKLFTTLSEGYTGWYAKGNSKTYTIDNISIRAESIVGRTNVEVTEPFWFRDEFEEDSIGRYPTLWRAVSSAEIIVSGGKMLLASNWSNGIRLQVCNDKIIDGYISCKLSRPHYQSNVGLAIYSTGDVSSGYYSPSGQDIYFGFYHDVPSKYTIYGTKVSRQSGTIPDYTEGDEVEFKIEIDDYIYKFYVNGMLVYTTPEQIFDIGNRLVLSFGQYGVGAPTVDDLEISGTRVYQKPIHRGAMLETYHDGTQEVLGTTFIDDCQWDRRGEYTIRPSVTHDPITGQVVFGGVADGMIIPLPNISDFIFKGKFDAVTASMPTIIFGASELNFYTDTGTKYLLRYRPLTSSFELFRMDNNIHTWQVNANYTLPAGRTTVVVIKRGQNIYVDINGTRIISKLDPNPVLTGSIGFGVNNFTDLDPVKWSDIQIIAASPDATNGIAACIPPVGGGARYGVEESVYNTFTTENVNKGVYLTTAKVKTTNPNADEVSLEYTNDTTSITLNTTPIDVDATYTVKTAPITIDANETDTLRVSVKNSTTCVQSTNYVESLSLIPVSGDDVLYPQDLAFISGVKPSQKRKVEVK